MERERIPTAALPGKAWMPVGDEPDHQLAALDGRELAGCRLRAVLGPTSRFGARYFALLLDDGLSLGERPVLSGLYNRGPLPSYNWVEVAETNEAVEVGGRQVDAGAEGVERLYALLLETLPPGGHLMVEYDSPRRRETALALAHNVPAIATPLGEALYCAGAGARFKDWQIAEGGSEGPRKLQAYKPLTEEHAARWKREAADELRAFVARPGSTSDVVRAARERAQALLRTLP
jgi:hypothetical protein